MKKRIENKCVHGVGGAGGATLTLGGGWEYFVREGNPGLVLLSHLMGVQMRRL